MSVVEVMEEEEGEVEEVVEEGGVEMKVRGY